ncbi:MAG TPA: hypothetical protein GXZ65_07930 [Clostridiales bacterium]|jgi:hypothetical protein|nr:hypothetical protein [Clostridiales bacterium]
MANFIERLQRFKGSLLWKALRAIAYALMIVLTLIFFSGHGEFIYETF